MGKIHRYLENGAVYFVTTNTYRRKKIFQDVNACKFLLMCIGYHKYMLNFNLFGYCIMHDHFHLLLQPTSDKNNLSKIMQEIKGNFARKYNQWECQKAKLCNRHLSADYKWRDRNSQYKPVWQEGFYDIGVRNEKQILSYLEYMHWNPVKKNIVDHPRKYEFSSYHQYYGARREWVQLPINPIF